MEQTKQSVLDAVADLVWRQFDRRAEPGRQFTWPVPADLALPATVDVVRGSPDPALPATAGLPVTATITADLYLPPPLHCLVQFDDATHCTQARARLLAAYPPELPLSFDVGRYRADQAPGAAAVALADALADLLPPRHGFNPTVRLRADEIAEQPGPMPERVAALLARRLAVHAGTTFQQMIDNAGAKPHRTQGR